MSPYALGNISEDLAKRIAKEIVLRCAVGHLDIEGNEFARIFSDCIDAKHLASPLGVADVVWGKCAWSVKTLKATKPFSQSTVRLISGRNSPNFSKGISDYSQNIQHTGDAVLEIWNARVDEALAAYDDLRVCVLIRNMVQHEFVIFEFETTRYQAANFEWRVNGRGNLEGYDRDNAQHKFTWQPHGSQFTVIHKVPKSAFKFRLRNKIPEIERDKIMGLIGFEESWIEIIP